MKTTKLLILVTAASLFSISCSGTVTESGQPEGPTEITEEKDDGLYITDRTNKRWEVSHAFHEYGMRPDQFQFGLGPDAIQPLMFPKMLAPGDPGYPNDDESFRVLGVNLFGDARAYSLALMSRHEIANERFGEVNVAVAYWPLVDLAAVYSREIDDQVLTLAASGWTYKFTFVLYDKETESLWYHLEGTTGLTCISGHFKDRKLDELASLKTRWSNWKADNPNSKVLR